MHILLSHPDNNRSFDIVSDSIYEVSYLKQELIGKTIKSAKIKKLPKDDFGSEYDDKPILELEMTDGSTFEIISDYGGYTGNSQDEYPRFIRIKRVDLV